MDAGHEWRKPFCRLTGLFLTRITDRLDAPSAATKKTAPEWPKAANGFRNWDHFG
jgi:hypothetical protein